MDILSLGVPEFAMTILGLAGVAFVKLVDAAFEKDWKGVVTIIGSATLGGVIALFVDGLGVLQGIFLMLSFSGLITTLSFVGKQSSSKTVVNPEVSAG